VTARVAVIVFPGSNCDHDAVEGLSIAGADAELVWHGAESLEGFDAVVLPGGFAHGDYLRPGAIARFSPVMSAVARFAAEGAPVLGICNGFQVLTEAGLLPGALRRNAGLRFVCRPVELEIVSTRSVLTRKAEVGARLSIPINHYDGNYSCDPTTLAELVARDQIVLRYVSNPNGSLDRIAGVCNEAGNVAGLMPHPERAVDALLGCTDGLVLLGSVVEAALARSGGGGQPWEAPLRMPARSSTAAGTPASRQVE
jgi:phosphoribosylformylglycinamidine synthase subunit PurQ / glutaminase